MNVDPQTRRLLDKIELLERANNAQLETITKYRRRNCQLQRENEAYAALVGQTSIQATSGQHSEREGQ